MYDVYVFIWNPIALECELAFVLCCWSPQMPVFLILANKQNILWLFWHWHSGVSRHTELVAKTKNNWITLKPLLKMGKPFKYVWDVYKTIFKNRTAYKSTWGYFIVLIYNKRACMFFFLMFSSNKPGSSLFIFMLSLQFTFIWLLFKFTYSSFNAFNNIRAFPEKSLF